MSCSPLEGASKYLNNLLLSRGLLHNGKSIDFVCPADQNNSTDATMSQLINLVHDLILRRDRDAEQRETLAAHMRIMRNEESQRALDVQRLQDKNLQFQTQNASLEAQHRTLVAAAKKAEMREKELKEQMLKMKSCLDQVRAKCISDVRKRDLEIEKLKSHLGGLQRGKKDFGGVKVNFINTQPPVAGREFRAGNEVSNPDWSLENETNDFLAALVNETSTENVALRKIVEDTAGYLKSVLGIENCPSSDGNESLDGIGIPGQYRQSRQTTMSGSHTETLVPVQDLASQMSTILEECRTILRDPSFVPLEEVQVRDEEILKLRAGWEKMADRWKDAVMMMSQWRQKMVDGKGSLNVEELSDFGSALGTSVAMMPDGKPVLKTIEEEETSSMFVDQNQTRADGGECDLVVHELEESRCRPSFPTESESVVADEGNAEESDLDLTIQPTPKRLATSPARRGVKLRRPGRPLRDTVSNTKHVKQASGDDKSTGHSSDQERFNDSDKENAPRATERTRMSKLSISEKLALAEEEVEKVIEQVQTHRETRKRKSSARDRRNKESNARRDTLSPEELVALLGGQP